MTSARFAIHDNVFRDLNVAPCTGAGMQVQLLTGLTDATIARNTFVVGGSSTKSVSFDGPPTVRLTLDGNVFSRSSYGVIGSGTGEGISTLTKYAPDGVFTGNALTGAVCSRYPVTTLCPSTFPTTGGADAAKVSAMTTNALVNP